MNRLAISQAAAALLKALIARSGAARDRILLIDSKPVDWWSLTLAGERQFDRAPVSPPHSDAIANSMCAGLEDARRLPPECDCRGYRRRRYAVFVSRRLDQSQNRGADRRERLAQ